MSLCKLCGCAEFYLEDGFYYCTQCQTQIEGVQEEVQEFSFGIVQTEGRKTKEKQKDTSKKSFGDELTSWEMYNIILRGFVNQMIAVGASKNLKVVVLQLWATYLSHIGVAFNGIKRIKFNLGYKKRDVELLSGQTFDVVLKKKIKCDLLKVTRMNNNKRKTKNKDVKKSIQGKKTRSTDCSSGTLTKLKRKLVEAESSLLKSQNKDFIESSQLQSQSQTLENLIKKNEEEEKPLDKFEVSCHTELLSRVLETHVTHLNKQEKYELSKIMNINHVKSAHNLSLSKLIGILQLGMVLSHQEAQVGDTLRWMTEGHLSYDNVRSFFHSDLKIPFRIVAARNKKMSHAAIRLNLKRIADVLSIKTIPMPNFFKLTARYCLELQLPDELLQKVHKLLVLYPPKEKFSGDTSFEAQAMSYIIVTLKLFFGLDDCTEKNLSDIAGFLNRNYQCRETLNEKYFSWIEWVKFIECRKTVVAHFHYPTRISVCKGNYVQGDKAAFLSYWHKRNIVNNKKDKTAEKIFGENMERMLDDLGGMIEKSKYIEFPGTLTPMMTYSNELLCHHSNKLYPEATNILKKSFKSYNLLHPKKLSKLKNFVNIIEQNSSLRCLKKIPLLLSDSIPSTFKSVPVDAVVVEENQSPSVPVRKRKRSHSDENLSKIVNKLLKRRLVEVEGKLKELENDSVQFQKEDFVGKTFNLGKPFQQYWYLHGTFYRPHRPLYGDDFDEFSRKKLSSSFLWLLKECSRMIGLFPRDLYYEIVNTETLLK